MPSSGMWRCVLFSALQLIFTANAVPNSLILSTLKMETCSSHASALTRPTRPHILEDCILHGHRRENLKSYIALTGWALKRGRNVSPVR
jgi:hypothetical protein